MKLVFIRHGQTIVNVSGLTHVPDSDIGLDEIGIEQARCTAKYCESLSIEKIYSSPEKRTVETAEIIAGHLKISVNNDERLRERNWGDWNGKPWEEIKSVLDKKSLAERYSFIPPNGESWEQMETRLREFLKSVTSSIINNVGVVTHGGAMRGLMPIVTGNDLSEGLKYDFLNASITIFEYNNGNFKEALINNIDHLSK